jgi:hypothetical protein
MLYGPGYVVAVFEFVLVPTFSIPDTVPPVTVSACEPPTHKDALGGVRVSVAGLA